MITLDKIYHAAFVLKEVARRTDLIHAPNLVKDAELYLKTENLQVTGSFKLRGAYYKISQLTEEQKKAGIIACSAGNHAQGVALAATRQGARSVVYMPDSAPISKVEATKRLGAEVVLVAGAYDDAYAAAVKAQEETGATFIHPFDDDEVIAGQGTIGLEILEQMRDVDAVIVPIGGGGLISGVAFAIKQLQPSVKVYGVQALNAPSMFESHRQGHQITLDTVHTFADGIAVKHPGDTTFSLVEKYVDDIVTVSEDEIATAILATIEKQKLIAEGAGAVSVAAAMFHKLPIIGKKVGLPGLRRQYRRQHPLPGHHPRLGDVGPQRQPGHRPGGQARPAGGRQQHHLQLRRQCDFRFATSGPTPTWPSPAASSGWAWRRGDFAQIDEIRRRLTEAGFEIVQ